MHDSSIQQTLRVADMVPGLRERKKLQTREALVEAARRLYRKHGYQGVTVAAIAKEANVAPRTFFGYFESKEDVFLSRGDDRLDLLVRAIRERGPDQPILAAVRPVLLQEREPRRPQKRDAGPDLVQLLRQPAVLARLRQRWNRWEDLLADAIATNVGAAPDDPEPRVVAAALTAAIRVAAVAAQEQPRQRRRIAERVFELLASGLARYGAGRKKPRHTSSTSRRIRAVSRIRGT